MEEFVNKLNLPFDGKIVGEEYVIQLDTSNDFSDLFTCISTNNDLDLQPGSITTEGNAMYVYWSEEFEILLTADFEKDIYNLRVSYR